MNKLKKARELSLLKRKVILYAVLFVLAVSMIILIGRGFTNRVAGFDSKPFLDQFEMDEEIGESFLQIQEANKELQELMDQMPDMATTTTSADDVDYQ